jgi:hypothetical protein
VSREQLQLVDRNAFAGETRQRLVTQVVPAEIDSPQLLTF